MKIASYKPRWIKPEHEAGAFNLWHLSRTALAGASPGRYKRLLWTSSAFAKAHPYVTATAAYKDLDGMTQC